MFWKNFVKSKRDYNFQGPFFVLQKFREIKECFENQIATGFLFCKRYVKSKNALKLQHHFVLQKFCEIKECFTTSASSLFFFLQKFREIKVQESNPHRLTKLCTNFVKSNNAMLWMTKISWNQRMTQHSDPCYFCCKKIVQEIAVMYFTIRLGVFY